MARPFWFILGILSLAAGAAGVVLPLVPATPFLLLAAYCFARSSPRLHAWLLAHPRFGPVITDWQAHGAIARNAKVTAVLVIVATFGASIVFGVPGWILAVQAVVLSAVTIFILTRPGRPGAP
jgi:uncharacterized membrane protein YbaN (DUF454 family)